MRGLILEVSQYTDVQVIPVVHILHLTADVANILQ